MIRRPPRSTRTDTLFPYPTLFRSDVARTRRVAHAGDSRRDGLDPAAHACRVAACRAADADSGAEDRGGDHAIAGGTAGRAGRAIRYRRPDRELRRRLSGAPLAPGRDKVRSEEHTSEHPSLMRISF